MTRAEAITLRPGTKVEYQAMLGISALWGMVLLWNGLSPDQGQRPDLVSLTGALIVLLPAAQAAERLFWPIRAAQRTVALSSRARGILKAAKFVPLLLMLAWIAYDFLSGHRHHTGIFWIFWIYGSFFFSDLLGESPFAQRVVPPEQLHITPSSGQLSSIQSNHWGDR